MSADSRPLSGDRAVVTGASSGIGRAIAIALADAGADVLVHARRSREAAREVASRCSALGARAEVALCDLGEPRERTEFLENAIDRFGPISIWVNNAGADVLTGAAADLAFDDKLDLLWRVDVLGTIALSRGIGSHMRASRSRLSRPGVVLNIGWDQASSGMADDSGQFFGASKGAIMAFTKSLAACLAPDVRVNCLAPGWIRTKWGESASATWQDRVLRETPLRRWGSPDDVASAAVFLASPGASFITGQIVAINGGAVR